MKTLSWLEDPVQPTEYYKTKVDEAKKSLKENQKDKDFTPISKVAWNKAIQRLTELSRL